MIHPFLIASCQRRTFPTDTGSKENSNINWHKTDIKLRGQLYLIMSVQICLDLMVNKYIAHRRSFTIGS